MGKANYDTSVRCPECHEWWRGKTHRCNPPTGNAPAIVPSSGGPFTLTTSLSFPLDPESVALTLDVETNMITLTPKTGSLVVHAA